jgi:hypothetical protein
MKHQIIFILLENRSKIIQYKTKTIADNSI